MKLFLQRTLMLFIFCPAYLWADPTITYYELALQSTAITAAFYASAFVLLMVFALFNLSSRNHIGLWYTLLFAIGLLFVACLDGTGSHLIWGNYPFFDRWLPLATLLILNACGLLLASYTLDTRLPFYPILKISMNVAGYLSLVLIILIPVGFQFYLALWGNIGFLLMVVAQVITTLGWRTPKVNPSEEAMRYSSIFSRITSLVFFIATAITGLILWHQSQQDTYSYADFIYVGARTVYLILSCSLVVTFMAHIMGIQRDHDHALRLELESTRRAALASEEKLKAERDFFRMKELAQQRRQQLSAASHDIRQPLVSLQLTLDKLSESSHADQKPEYQQALEYISQLAESYTYPDSGIENSNEDVLRHEVEQNDTEELPISLLFKTIQQMFEPEANTKNTELRFVDTNMSALVDPSAVMRIISNLVSNALAHTQSKKILLGCRRQGNSIFIQVYDQGEGLSQSEFQQMQQLHHKSETSKGEGIGLANCVELAAKSGYELSLTSTAGKGCCFSLLVPRQVQT